MNNKTNEIEKYESLVRLINNDGLVISPFFFINISKKAGYYDKITEIVLENSFEALNNTDKEITINLSTMDIENIYIRNKLLGLITIPKLWSSSI
jgi:EAL domain-containing protein (putative c-di-GMP-specific phosphodiesterase class I)